MTKIRAMTFGLALLSLSAPATQAQQAQQTPEAVGAVDPYRNICASGYVKSLEVSGVENVGQGWYPWLIATIDQTGFQGGGTTTVNTYFTGDQQGDKKWALILGAFQTAYLSRVPIRVYSPNATAPCVAYPRDLTVRMCTNEVDCGGVRTVAGADTPQR